MLYIKYYILCRIDSPFDFYRFLCLCAFVCSLFPGKRLRPRQHNACLSLKRLCSNTSLLTCASGATDEAAWPG